MKWSFVPKQSATPKYVLCNGDESEPGTCKDRLIFEHDPHAVIEGVMIAAIAVGSPHWLYLHSRRISLFVDHHAGRRSRNAYAKGFLGKNIFGSGYDLDIFWHGGAGAYEFGEEIRVDGIAGRQARIPRIRPPFPAVVGLWGGPTVIITQKLWPLYLLSCWAARNGLPGLGTPKNAAPACSVLP